MIKDFYIYTWLSLIVVIINRKYLHYTALKITHSYEGVSS